MHFRYEITVEDRSQCESGRNGLQRNEEYRPETSFGIRRDETRTSKREQEQGSSGQEGGQDSVEGNSVQKRIEELQKRAEQEGHFNSKPLKDEADGLRVGLATKMIGETKRLDGGQYNGKEPVVKLDRKDDLEQGIGRLKIQNQGSGSDYDKAGQSSSNVDSGRGSAVYSSGRRPPPDDQTLAQGKNRFSAFTLNFFTVVVLVHTHIGLFLQRQLFPTSSKSIFIYLYKYIKYIYSFRFSLLK